MDKQQRRDRLDVIFLYKIRMVVHIDLNDLDVWSFLIDLFKLGVNCLARVAPRRPKVYNGTTGPNGFLEGR